jgi:peptide/nickel transport system substrate-binding protein
MRLGRREILLAALLVLVAVALSSTVDGQTPKRGGILRIANTGEPPTIDYSATTVGVTSNIATAIFETPFAFDASWRPQPMLVESHSMSSNGLTHTFKLRRGVLFHNGKEMTSEDVAASLTRWGKVGSRGIVAFKQVEAVTTPDKYTVVMNLKEPFAPLLAFLALPSSAAAIMPKEVADATPAGPVTQYIGTGPYRFVEWIPNRHIKLARWDKYVSRSEAPSGYAGRRDPLVDEVIYYPVGNVATRIAGVQAGDYDIADAVSTDLYAQLKTDPRVVIDAHEPGSWLVFFFNKKAGIMANVKLRQAVMAALSMQPILQVTVGNPDLFQLTPSIYPKGTPWYTEVGARWYNQGNADLAKKLAAEAGYKGEPIRWLTTQQYDWSHKSSTVATAQLKQAGFNVDQQTYEWAGVVERRAKPEAWELFTTLHGFVPDPALIDVFSPAYPGWWDTPAKNQLLADMNRALDLQTRVQTWQKLQELVFTEGGWVKTGDFLFVRLRAKGIEGYKPIGIGMIVWNVSVAK